MSVFSFYTFFVLLYQSVRKVWVNPLKKKKLKQKSFFQIMLNEVLKTCEKMILADLKANKNNKN